MSGLARRVVFACEACGCALVKRTSYLSHKFLRHDIYACSNPLCGASYSGHSELTGIASPSGEPDAPPSDLPPTPGYLRTQAAQAWRESHGSGQQKLELGNTTTPADGDPAPVTA